MRRCTHVSLLWRPGGPLSCADLALRQTCKAISKWSALEKLEKGRRFYGRAGWELVGGGAVWRVKGNLQGGGRPDAEAAGSGMGGEGAGPGGEGAETGGEGAGTGGEGAGPDRHTRASAS